MEVEACSPDNETSTTARVSVLRPGLGRTLLLWFLLFALVPVSVVSVVGSIQARGELRKAAEDALVATAELKTRFIENWFHYRFAALEVQANNIQNARFLERLSTEFLRQDKPLGDFVGSFAWELTVDELGQDLAAFKKFYGYYDVLLIDTLGNVLFAVVREDDLGTNLFTGPYKDTLFATSVQQALETGRPTFSDFEFHAPAGGLESGFISSVVLDENGDTLGVITFQIPTGSIDQILQERSGLGETGETYLVGHDFKLRSHLAQHPEEAVLREEVRTEATIAWQNASTPSEWKSAGASVYLRHGSNQKPVLGVLRPLQVQNISWAVLSEIEAAEAFAGAARLKHIAIGMVIIMGIVIIVLVVPIARQIVRPVMALTVGAKRAMTGDYDHEVRVNARNELGILAQSFNEMLRNLGWASKERALKTWFEEGISALNVRMRGEGDLGALSQAVLTCLAEYLDARVGTLYASEEGELRLKAGFAIQKNAVSKSFSLGEGIVGQVGLEKKRVLLESLPEGYLLVGSSLGNTQPRSLLVLPILQGDELKGVLELGFLEPVSKEKQKFLEQASEGVAIAMQSAQSRTQLQTLFDQTQAQAEELQAQSFELSAKNTKLETQTGILRESEAKLQAQQEELQQTNEELAERGAALEEQRDQIQRNNIELHKAQLEIEAKARDLELSSRYKSEFLANMSHELRTPLNSLLILSQVLAENRDGNLSEKQVEAAKTIYGGGQSLLVLINDILDLSKVEAGKIDLVYENANLVDLSDSLTRYFEHMASEQGLDFTVRLGRELPATVRTDRQRVEQILRNLISNALKFTEKGGVEVEIGFPDDSVVFSRKGLDSSSTIFLRVRDSGVGIPPEKQALIFGAFQQADGTTSRKYGGTGLGLSICREFSVALGGEIQVESRVGEGSVFTLYLPREGETIESSNEQHAAPPLFIEGNIDVPPEMPEPGDEPSAGDTPKLVPSALDKIRDDRRDLQPTDKSLLIIEDDPDFVRILVDVAHEHGFKCVVAGEGETGLQHASVYQPSAILLDVGLPRIDGWEVMRRLKNDSDTRHIPVHFVSAVDASEKPVRAGAIGYVTKPLSVELMEETFASIEDVVGRPVKDLLVVSDRRSLREEISELVGNGDVKVTCAESAVEAEDLLCTRHFDCMVLDLGLSEKSGVILLQTIRGDHALWKLPVVVYTGKDLTEEEECIVKEYSETIPLRAVESLERLLDATALFLHRVESNLPPEKQEMLRMVHDKETALKGRRILLADDDMRNVFALSAVLEGKGVELIVAKNGLEAVKSVESRDDIDLVLMDIMMPEMDGCDAMRAIRKIEGRDKLPIIALTAKAMKGDRQKCIACGASDYLSKPIVVERLLSLLRVWLYR